MKYNQDWYIAISLSLTLSFVTGCQELPYLCPPEDCGHNGAQVAEQRFGPLSLRGEVSARSLAIVDIMDAEGQPLTLDIHDAEFVALDPKSGLVVRRGGELHGVQIIVAEAGDDETTEWLLTIEVGDHVSPMSSKPDRIPTYIVTYAPVGMPGMSQPLCRDGGPIIAIEGEVYDDESLKIHTYERKHWFHMACRDHLLWKSARMSYTPHRTLGHKYATTPTQRRATLAMVAADYCGDGQRFTRPGIPLYWQNRDGWMVEHTPPTQGAVIEAGWGAHGATCLGTPRLSERYTHIDIEAECGRTIPVCTPDVLANSEWTTWIPTL